MQDGRVPVGDTDFVFHSLVSDFVGRTVDEPSFHPSTSHPETETLGIVIPTRELRAVKLSDGCTSKFTAPDDECTVEQAPLLEVLKQGADGLVGA